MKKNPNFALLQTDLVILSLAPVTYDPLEFRRFQTLWCMTDELIGLVQYVTSQTRVSFTKVKQS